MALNREQRRERRRRVLKAAVRLAHELWPEDEGERRAWLAATLAAHLDIPLLGERAEQRAIAAVIELIEDLVD
tara:strand:- start:4559 stop:4777 length:219 start_codon:yes stop_codon:yes gene_type:complete